MQVSDVERHAPLGKSDHDVICFKFNCYIDYSKPKDRFVYHKTDFNATRKDLGKSQWEEDYMALENEKNSEELWGLLKSKLLELRNKYVPKQQSTKPSWKDIGGFPIDKTLKEAIRQKHSSHRHWISAIGRAHAGNSRLKYARARNKVTKLMRQAKRKFESNIARDSKTNPKAFWSHVRSKLKTKRGVAPLLENPKDKNSIKFSDEEKANILQKQFASVFTREPDGDTPKLALRTSVDIGNL